MVVRNRCLACYRGYQRVWRRQYRAKAGATPDQQGRGATLSPPNPPPRPADRWTERALTRRWHSAQRPTTPPPNAIPSLPLARLMGRR